jgi:hypothetical protein
MPLWKADFEFLQNASAEVIGALCKALFDRDYGVLWGCEVVINNSKTHVSEGYVFVDGEVVHVPAQMIAGDYPEPILQKTDNFNTAGDKIFKVDGNTETRQTYLTPYMQLKIGIVHGPGKIVLNDEGKKTLLQRIHEILSVYEIIEYSNDTIMKKCFIKYAKIGKQVHVMSFSGYNSLDPAPPDNMIKIYEFPEGFRPAVETIFLYHGESTGDVKLGKVLTDGKALFHGGLKGAAIAFSFLTP